jgi:tRNA A37 threonylcarbamoyladenosine biosynthesis protein TsaE
MLMNQYQGIHPLFHFDLYRLGDLPGTLENPIDEFFGEGVVAVEWAQYLGRDYFGLAEAIAVDISIIDDTRRRFCVSTELGHISLS